jgi:hypothetical protein
VALRISFLYLQMPVLAWHPHWAWVFGLVTPVYRSISD